MCYRQASCTACVEMCQAGPRVLLHASYHYALRAKIIFVDFILVVSTLTAKPPNLIHCQIFRLYSMKNLRIVAWQPYKSKAPPAVYIVYPSSNSQVCSNFQLVAHQLGQLEHSSQKVHKNLTKQHKKLQYFKKQIHKWHTTTKDPTLQLEITIKARLPIVARSLPKRSTKKGNSYSHIYTTVLNPVD